MHVCISAVPSQARNLKKLVIAVLFLSSNLAISEEIQSIGTLDEVSGPVEATSASCQLYDWYTDSPYFSSHGYNGKYEFAIVWCRLSPSDTYVNLLVNFRDQNSVVLFREGEVLVSKSGNVREVVSSNVRDAYISPSGEVIISLLTRESGVPTKSSVWHFDSAALTAQGKPDLLFEEGDVLSIQGRQYKVSQVSWIQGVGDQVTVDWQMASDSPDFSDYFYLDLSSGETWAFPNDFSINVPIDGEDFEVEPQSFGRGILSLYGQRLAYVYQSKDPGLRLLSFGPPGKQVTQRFPSVNSEYSIIINSVHTLNNKLMFASEIYGGNEATFLLPTFMRPPLDTWWSWTIDREQAVNYQSLSLSVMCDEFWSEFRLTPLPRRRAIVMGNLCVDGLFATRAILHVAEEASPEVLLAGYGVYDLGDPTGEIEIDYIDSFYLRGEGAFVNVRTIDDRELVAFLNLCDGSMEWMQSMTWEEAATFQVEDMDGSWQLLRRFDLRGCLLADRVFFDSFVQQ